MRHHLFGLRAIALALRVFGLRASFEAAPFWACASRVFALCVLVALAIALPASSFAQGRGRGGQPPAPPRPAPRSPDGHPNLGPPPGETGVWLPGNARFAEPEDGGRGARGANANPALAALFAPVPGAPPKPKVGEVPWQQWAKGVYDYRLANQFEPHTRCKPSGGAREFFTPYGVEFVDMPELKRMYIMDIGGPHTYRIIYMDGREHPKNLEPTYYGHSIGHWDGDALVVDTIGFNEKFWMDREGSPHTEKLHFIERFTRMNMNAMKYEITIDDPGAYTGTWSTGSVLRWSPGQELFEYVCQDNNHAPELMLGDQKSVDRSSVIIP